MGRGGVPYLSYTVFFLLSTVTSSRADLWTVDIDNGPAPSPEDGPPFSAHASRDRDLLPYQIIGVVGAYLGFVLILGSLLLTVGRKLRRQAQNMATRPIELVKPPLKAFEMSPGTQSAISPQFSASNRFMASLGSSKAMSPGGQSVSSVDLSVIEEDKRRRDIEMAQIYGQVYEFEKQTMRPGGTETTEAQPDDAQYPRPRSELRPLDVRRVQSSGSSHLASPISPRSVQAIHPPQYLNPRSPVSVRFQTHGLSEQEERSHRPSIDGPSPHPAPLSKRHRKPFGKLNISSPMASRLGDDNSDGARTPLAPRFYTDPGTPPEPPSAMTVDSHYQSTSPVATTSWQETRDREGHDMGDVRPIPMASPQRLKPALKLSPTQRGNMPPISTNNFLPLRAYQNQYPLSPTASQTKTTVVESKGRSFPTTAGATPYSAYFPGVNTEPRTPHLTTRAERLQQQKEEKALRGPIVEGEQVKDDLERVEFGDAYR